MDRPVLVQSATPPLLRDCTDKELNLPQPSGKYRFGKYHHTVQVDTELYLPWLMEMFTEQGEVECRAMG